MSDSSLTADDPLSVTRYTYPRNPIVRHLTNLFIDENEHAYCEYCKQTPCRNTDFYTCTLCSTEFSYWLTEKNYQYLTSLGLFVETQHDRNNAKEAHPLKYAREIRFYTYKSYASAYDLPWGNRDKNPLPECALAMLRLLFRAPAENAFKWIEIHPMMYHVKEQGNDTVLLYTNKYSCLLKHNQQQYSDAIRKRGRTD